MATGIDPSIDSPGRCNTNSGPEICGRVGQCNVRCDSPIFPHSEQGKADLIAERFRGIEDQGIKLQRFFRPSFSIDNIRTRVYTLLALAGRAPRRGPPLSIIASLFLTR